MGREGGGGWKERESGHTGHLSLDKETERPESTGRSQTGVWEPTYRKIDIVHTLYIRVHTVHHKDSAATTEY
jgi:hypothetical protein